MKATLKVDLCRLRLLKGLSAEAAAAEMGLRNKQVLLQAEKGISFPQPSNALKIAKFYELEVDQVWDLNLDESSGEAKAA